MNGCATDWMSHVVAGATSGADAAGGVSSPPLDEAVGMATGDAEAREEPPPEAAAWERSSNTGAAGSGKATDDASPSKLWATSSMATAVVTPDAEARAEASTGADADPPAAEALDEG